MIRLKNLILETPSTFFYALKKNNFSYIGFSNPSVFVFAFTILEKKIIIFKYFLTVI